MNNIFLLTICLIIGVILQKLKIFPKETPSILGTFILYVPLPAVCLLTVPNIEWDLSLISLCLAAWIIFAMSFATFNFLGRKFGWNKELIGCLILTTGFCNSSFVGFPVIEGLFGKEALKYAVLFDQPGTFLIVSSLGLWVALSASSQENIPFKMILKKVFQFPPFLAFILGIILGIFDVKADGGSKEILERLASTLTPLALISIGLLLEWDNIKDEFRYLAFGLTFKLILVPLTIFSIYSFLNLPREIYQIAVLESGMAPMTTATILAVTHKLKPKLAGMMIGFGVPLSFLTLSLWFFILNSF